MFVAQISTESHGARHAVEVESLQDTVAPRSRDIEDPEPRALPTELRPPTRFVDLISADYKIKCGLGWVASAASAADSHGIQFNLVDVSGTSSAPVLVRSGVMSFAFRSNTNTSPLASTPS